MPKSELAVAVFSIQKMCCGNGKHLQKTMHYTTECDVAVAQVRVSFFYLLTGSFLIALVEKLMP
jgi:hypothetical protein